MKGLNKEKSFEYSSNELLGVMRFDFYDGGLANKWNPRDLIIELNNKKEIDLKKLQQELNYIQFDLINNFDTVVRFCNGRGYNNETLVYIDLEVAKYVIKLVPVRDSYSYIYTYLKEVRQMSILKVLKILGTVLTVVVASIEANEQLLLDVIL